MNTTLGGAALFLVALSPSAASAAPPAPRAAAAAPAPDAAARPAIPGPELRGEINAIPIFALGVLPSPALGVSPYLGFRWPRLSLGLEARFLKALDRTPLRDDVRTEASVVFAVPSACGHSGLLFLCGAVGVGQLDVTGDPDDHVGTGDPWMATLGLRGGLDGYIAPRFVLRAFAEGSTVLGRPSVRIASDDAWTAPPVALVLGLGFMIPIGGAGPY